MLTPDILQTDVVEDNVENVAEALNIVTQELENPDPEKIEDIADTFTNIVNVEVVTPEVIPFSLHVCEWREKNECKLLRKPLLQFYAYKMELCVIQLLLFLTLCQSKSVQFRSTPLI